MDLSKLKRYSLDNLSFTMDDTEWKPSKNGKYVKYEDVEKLINKNKKVVNECATCKYYKYNNIPANGIALCNFCVKFSKWEPNNA